MKRLLIFTLIVVSLANSRAESDEFGVGEFFDAIRAADADAVRKLAEANPKLLDAQDLRSTIGATPIQVAINPRLAPVLNVLLELGADPNARNARGEPAMLFLRSQSPQVAAKLLDAGGDIDIASHRGLTLLHYACADSRNHTLAKFLIQRGANVNARGPQGVTPLHVGVALGAASLLIPAGGDPNLPDWMGQSAHFKVRSAKQLESIGTPPAAADLSGWTLLHQFAWQGNLDAVTWLLNQESLARQINSVNDEGTSPLAAAARFGETKIVEALLAAGADPTSRDNRGWSAAEIARHRGFDELADRLTRTEVNGRVFAKAQAARCRITPLPNARTNPGKLVVDPPTLCCLGFRWWIEGDANRNAGCDIEFRAAGSETWNVYYPALRIGGETSDRGWTNPDMVAGSIIDLEPGTNYEVRLTLSDPDNTEPIVRTLKLATRTEPAVDFRGNRLLNVGGETPQFATVQSAYDAARPGDVILIHPGEYPEDLVMNKAATADKPIVIRGEGNNVVLRGIGNDLIDVDGARHHVFENLTLVDADNGFLARGETHALTVRRCRFRDIGKCFFALSQRNRGFLIYDNDMDGPIKDWHPRQTIKSQGVWIAGQGHAIFHNRIRGFWDGLSIKGEATDDPELQNCAIDFYNNDLSEFLDDAIELDYGMHNLRCMRNRIRNTFMGISTQPVEGGPAYIYRNTVYACSRHPLKLNVSPSGLLIFHNTFVADGHAGAMSHFQNSRIYNNIFVGRESDYLLSGGTTTPTSDVDYNAYRMHPPKNADTRFRIRFIRVFPGRTMSGGGLHTDLAATTFDQFARLSHQRFEHHGAWPVDYSDFVACPIPDVEADQHDARPVDLRLRNGSAMLDKGKRLIGFNGEKPDLGAYEFNQQPPVYGPR